MLKKDKMVSCREPECTDRADKNFNIISLGTIIIIFKILAYLMPET